MRIIDNNGIKELYADENMMIRRKNDMNIIVESVSLCSDDSPDNWEDCEKEIINEEF